MSIRGEREFPQNKPMDGDRVTRCAASPARHRRRCGRGEGDKPHVPSGLEVL